jgi:hypothetical protein
MADKNQIEKWIEDYGEDSDFVRVRVKGQEPRRGATQLIGDELVELAANRVLHPSVYNSSAKVLSIDVARFGDDQSVFIKRQGLAAYDLQKFRGLDTMALASQAARVIDDWNPDAVFIDVVGIGAGVVDRLRQLNFDVMEVNGGRSATEDNKYFNKRAEMWSAMEKWLQDGGAIPDDKELRAHLCAPEYGFDNRERIQLEKKSDLKDRLGESPDCGDALAMSFAEPVIAQAAKKSRKRNFANYEYDVVNYA